MVRNEEGVGGKLFGLLLPRNPCDSVALCDSDTLALSWQINSFQVFMDMSVESVEACDWQCRVSDFTTRDANRSHVEACNQVVIYASMERVIQCWCLDQCACK